LDRELRLIGRRVDDEDVDRSELIADGADELLDAPRIRDIRADESGFGPERANLLVRGLRLRRVVQVVDANARSGAGERERDRFSEPFRAPCDEGDAPRE